MIPKEKKFTEEFNPPATVEEIADAEKQLGIHFPDKIKGLYSHYNGIPEYRTSHLPFHLMPLFEMVEFNKIFHEKEGLIKKYGLFFFWSDDQSNYAGVFLNEPLQGAVSFLDHEGYYVGDLSPLFRDVESFANRVVELADRNLLISQFDDGLLEASALKKLINEFPYGHYKWNDTADWHAMPVDYPAPDAATIPGPQDLERLGFVKQALEENQFTMEDEREFLVYSLARLIPWNEAGKLLPYLEENHMHIPSQVCNTLFLRRFDQAIPAIAKLAIAGNHNCQTSAEMTLAKFAVTGTKGEKDRIKEEYQRLNGNFDQFSQTVKNFKSSPTLIYQW